jgi:hypothetical protein
VEASGQGLANPAGGAGDHDVTTLELHPDDGTRHSATDEVPDTMHDRSGPRGYRLSRSRCG